MLNFDQKLALVQNQSLESLLGGFSVGLEKESLRISPRGALALTDHPQKLGSALTHPYITTDYAEALLELITDTYGDLSKCHQFLEQVHKYCHQKLNQELLWPSSMPCFLHPQSEIQIAKYGTSNSAKMKEIYRKGLHHRYGSQMQVVAGVHFNFSMNLNFMQILAEAQNDKRELKDFVSQSYMDLIRNVHRYGWLIVYLFGASPAICQTFLGGREPVDYLRPLGERGTLVTPYGTSLRMSDLGYTTHHQSEIDICYNTLDDYLNGLRRAIRTESPIWKKLGVKVAGEYRQLNANLLQIENEYYAIIRPKRASRPGVSPSCLLLKEGIEYVEFRGLDLNPFDPAGISTEQMAFLTAFLTYCGLKESLPCKEKDYKSYKHNLAQVIKYGRSSGLKLERQGSEVSLAEWGLDILKEMEPVAALLDKAQGKQTFSYSITQASGMVKDPQATLSGKFLKTLDGEDNGFFNQTLSMAKNYQEYFAKLPANKLLFEEFDALVESSFVQQLAMESSDDMDFDQYLAKYLNEI